MVASEEPHYDVTRVALQAAVPCAALSSEPQLSSHKEIPQIKAIATGCWLEEFLEFKAPGDWIYIELTRWGELYASHERAKARIAELRYQIESRVDSYLPRWLAALGLVPANVAERGVMIAALGKFVNGSSVDLPNFSLLAITDPALSFEKSK